MLKGAPRDDAALRLICHLHWRGSRVGAAHATVAVVHNDRALGVSDRRCRRRDDGALVRGGIPLQIVRVGDGANRIGAGVGAARVSGAASRAAASTTEQLFFCIPPPAGSEPVAAEQNVPVVLPELPARVPTLHFPDAVPFDT